MAGDGFLKLEESQEGEMLQAAWEPFLELHWALSEFVSLQTQCKTISWKNMTLWNSKIKEALGSKDMFFEKLI